MKPSPLALAAGLAVAALATPTLARSVTFLPPTSIALGNSSNGAHSMDTGDLNHDGRPDIVVVDWLSNVVDVIVGQSGGGFAPVVRIPTPDGPFYVVLADLNQDTHLDIVTANRVASNISVYLGDGTGAFQPRVDYATPSGSSVIAVGDVTGDGFLDVVGAADLRVDVLAGNGSGQLSAPTSTVLGTTLAASQIWGIALGDLDGDGDLDVVANYNGPLVELRNAGNGTFMRQDFGSNIGSRALAIADVTGDGHKDVIAGSEFQNGIIVFTGNGVGGLTQNPVIATGAASWSERIVDLDGDGRVDLVAANSGTNSISVLLGTGSGLGPATTLGTANIPLGVCVPDVNGDGKPDIVDTGYSGLVLFRLQGTPTPPPPDTTGVSHDGEWHELAPLGKIAYHEGVYDAKRQCLWIFGGRRKDTGARNEVWAFDFSGGSVVSRELIVPGAKPSPRTGHTLILDAAHDRLMVYGGSGTNDVWALNLAGPPSWQQLLPAGTPPSARSGTIAVYDSLRDRMIVFGGRDASSSDLNDVWTLSLGPSPAWTQIAPSGSLPPPRSGHKGVYDPIGDRLVIVGGQGSTTLGDVWALSLSAETWSQLSASGVNVASARVVMDPVRNRLVLYGGGSWITCQPNPTMAFNLSSPGGWTTINSSGGRTDHVAVYDPIQDRLIVHAGVVPSCNFSTYYWLEDLVVFSFGTSTWSTLTPVITRPSIRFRPLMIYVPSRDEAIVVGGSADGGFGVLTDTWRLDLHGSPAWSPLFASGSPPIGLSGSSAIYDPVRDRMLFFGGGSTGNGDPSTTLSCLALGAAPGWQPISASGSPPPQRCYHSAIYDPSGDRMIVFGGNTGGLSSNGFIYDDVWQLTLSPPMTWSQLFPPGARPGPRYSHGAVYDLVRQRMIVTGGKIAGGSTSETWALPLTGSLVWTQIVPSGAPPTTTNRDVPPVYDSARDRLVFLDGAGSTYELSLPGTPTWTLLPFTSAPPNRSLAATVYDENGDRMIAFAGQGSAERFTCSFCSPLSATSDLWILGFPQAPTSVEPGVAPHGALALLAFPNPSRSETTLEFDVPTPRSGSVRVYDVSGRMVRELANGPLTAGRHQLRWDGRDANGGRVTPGLYFVRARLGDVERRRTIVRIR